MIEPRFTACGKQVLLDGRQFADAASNEAAQVIEIVCNAIASDYFLDFDEDSLVRGFLA